MVLGISDFDEKGGMKMKRHAWLLMIFTLAGCSAPGNYPYQASAPYSPISANSAHAYAGRDKQDATERKRMAEQRRDMAKTKEELDWAIRELEEATEALKKAESDLRQAESQLAESTQSSNSGASAFAPTTSGTINTGPRGGRYVITPSGKKRYIKK